MFDYEKRGRTTVVHVRGDIDVLTSESFREAVVRAEHEDECVVVSLLECRYLDSTGLSVMIAAQRRMGDRLAFALTERGNVHKIIDIASLAQFLRTVPSVDEGVRVVSQSERPALLRAVRTRSRSESR